MAGISCYLLCASVLLLLLHPSVHAQECGCDGVGAVRDECDSATGQCDCRPGVGGLKCDACLSGYTNFGPQGCTRVACQCNSLGSISEECDQEGACQCRPRVGGDQCSVCAFSYRNFMQGCTPCPPCFDQVAVRFRMTFELYQELLARLNFTLESVAGGGVSPALLAAVEEYRRTLEGLLQRALNATIIEEMLTSDHASFETSALMLRDIVSALIANLTSAESAFLGLEGRLQGAESTYIMLQGGVASLEVAIHQELRQLLEEVISLRMTLQAQLVQLSAVATEADDLSRSLQMQANTLVERILLTLQSATTALQRLLATIDLQDQTQSTVEVIESTLYPLEALVMEAGEALDNATREVPTALADASRALVTILNVSLEDFDLESRRREVADIEEGVSGVGSLVGSSRSLLEVVQGNFSALNATASRLLDESQSLNADAASLLNRSRQAFLLANQSARRGNDVIAEARELLRLIQARFSNMQDLNAGLEEVIRNIEMAERVSAMAEVDVRDVAEGVETVAGMVNSTVSMLEEATQRLRETMKLAVEVNGRADQLLSGASSLNASSAELAGEVAMATREVDELGGAVRADREAIASASRAASDSITLSADIRRRVVLINLVVENLTVELNLTETLSPARLREVTGELEALEGVADQTQQQVDMLTTEIERLQRSSQELSERYTMLLQHRSLLQEILSNIQDLDCSSQFVS